MWRSVPSGDNPTDDITWGLPLKDLGDGSRWAHRPAFLKKQPEEWPQPLCSPHNRPQSEMRQPAVVVLFTSVLQQLHVTAEGYAAAELEALRQAQRDSFPDSR